MPRTPKPWFWKARKEWVVNIGKKRHYLGPDKEEAHRRFHELMAAPKQEVPTGTILHIFEVFMDWVQANRSPNTYTFYQIRIDLFIKAVGNLRLRDLKSYHVQNWLDKQTWKDSYKAGIVTSLKRAFNWAVKQGYIDSSPLQGLTKPQANRRDQLITPEQFEQILSHVPNTNFKDLARFAWFSGCRPEEVVIIEPRHYEREHKRIALPPDEAKGRRRTRLIYLPDEAIEILERNLGNTPVFLNTLGRPWAHGTIASTFYRVKKKMGIKFCMYALRHSFANQSITKAGLSLEETAAALGHTSTKMVYEVYGHLVDSPEHMQKLVNRSAKARNGGS